MENEGESRVMSTYETYFALVSFTVPAKSFKIRLFGSRSRRMRPSRKTGILKGGDFL